jgi:HSP20 family protein
MSETTEPNANPAEATSESAPSPESAPPARQRHRWPDWGSLWDFPDLDLRWPERLAARFPDVFESEPGAMAMRIEESEQDGKLVIRGEIPDVDPDKDIDISVADGMLTIRAERRQREEHEEEGRRRSEFRYGSYYRRIRLPAGVTEEDIEANYRDGILEVHVPVAESGSSGRKVNVGRG